MALQEKINASLIIVIQNFLMLDYESLVYSNHLFISVEIPPEVLIELLIKMSDIENRLTAGTSEKLQLSALVAAFFVARSKIDIPAILT